MERIGFFVAPEFRFTCIWKNATSFDKSRVSNFLPILINSLTFFNRDFPENFQFFVEPFEYEAMEIVSGNKILKVRKLHKKAVKMIHVDKKTDVFRNCRLLFFHERVFAKRNLVAKTIISIAT